jgi:hypothetical protein
MKQHASPRHTRKHETHETRRRVFRVFLIFVVLTGVVRAAEVDPDIRVMPIEGDGQVLVSFDLSDGYTPDVSDAIQSGLSTTFSYDVELRRGAALFDRTIASVSITATVHFDNLTRRYQMSRRFDGRVEDARPSEDQDAVRDWMTHFERISLSRTSTLEANVEYYVRVRAQRRPHNAWFVWPWGGAVLGQAKFTFIQ